VQHNEPEPLREILERLFVRYLGVRPSGFERQIGAPLEPAIEARILAFGPARTFYKKHKLDCRSLDAVQSITHRERRCADCTLRERCTPQVRLDLVVDQESYRLLLAYTSARSFLAYVAELQRRAIPLERVRHRILVVDRGTCGELRFSPLD
jgi:hypothetical protein